MRDPLKVTGLGTNTGEGTRPEPQIVSDAVCLDIRAVAFGSIRPFEFANLKFAKDHYVVALGQRLHCVFGQASKR